MKPRTKKIIWGTVLGVLILGWYGSSQDKKAALASLEKGEEALAAQEWEVAVKSFSESLESSELYSTLTNEQVQAHLGRGTALAMLGQPTAAVQSFSVAYSLDPLSAPTTNQPLVVEASEKAKAVLEARREEAAFLTESGSFNQQAETESPLAASSTQEELLGILNQAASLLGDDWRYENLRINAKGGDLWLELDLKRKSITLSNDQVRAQSILALAFQAESLEEVFEISHVRLKCESSVGKWSIQNMKYASKLLLDEQTVEKGALLLISMME